MVLIPNDIGLRMRLQAEAQLLQAAAPVAEIATELPDLRPGQRFTARILEVLPEQTYKALVAGRTVTLSLPDAARNGDSLELVVLDRSPKAIQAQLAPAPTLHPDEPGNAGPYPYAALSRTGQWLATILPADASPAPTALGRAAPVLAAAPAPGPEPAHALASALATAVRRSGLFYESHLAQWAGGQLPLAELLTEPQAEHSDFKRLVTALLRQQEQAPGVQAPGRTPSPASNAATAIAGGPASVATEAASTSPHDAARIADLAPRLPVSLPRDALGAPHPDRPAAPSAAVAAPGTGSGEELPTEVRALVQQQLETGAAQRLLLHGEVWPGQWLEWSVEPDGRQGNNAGEDLAAWATTLRLTAPRLGSIAARIELRGTGVRLTLEAEDPASGELLRAGLPLLTQRLVAAGLTPGTLTVCLRTGESEHGG